MTENSILVELSIHVRKQAEKDLLFSGCKPLARLTEDEERVVCQALLHYAECGAHRAFTYLKAKGLIRLNEV